MNVYAASDYYEQFAVALGEMQPDLSVGSASVRRFPDGELYATVHDNPKGQDCLVIGSAAPPDEQLLSLLMLGSALKRSGAHSVCAFLPYVGYTRQDKAAARESSGIALIGSLLRAAGIDKIITIDVHSALDRKLIGLPLVSLPSSPLFAPAIQRLGWDELTVVAPDEGALERAQNLARTLGNSASVAHLVKQHVNGIAHIELVGQVSSRCVVTDDIIDTGQTLLSACRILRQRDVRDIAIAVTHGLFTGEAWPQLFNFGVRAFFVTDSCPGVRRQRHPGTRIVSLAPILLAVRAGAVRKKEQYESIYSR
jgi:ribose-phosphate pyrophosphokinase